VAPALLPLDRRAAPVVARWQAGGLAGQVARTSGYAVTPASQSAQLGWLGEHRPAVLDRAASVFCGKDWLYFACTGERAAEATAALGAFGDLTTGAYDLPLLEQLGLADAARLLPPIVDGSRQHGELAQAPAAATGLLTGTPVVAAPVDAIARGLAAGLGAGEEVGVSDPVAGGLHLRSCRERPDPGWPERGIAVSRFAQRWLGLATQRASLDPELLVGLAEQLLADAGLIGVPRSELAALLEAKAAAATPGALRCWRGGDDTGAAWHLSGVCATTTFYDLLRATHEALAAEAVACHGALGRRPRELRIVGTRAAAPLTIATLAACLGSAVRPLQRAAPAATGAALTAALSLGLYADLAAADAEWVEPFLGAPLAAAA
jgi:erythritol kinase